VPKNPDHYAVVIGIGQYPGLGDVAVAEGNAAAFVEWLKDVGRGDLPAENIYSLFSFRGVGEPAAIEPADIEQAFISFGLQKQQRIRKRLYFYFTGRACGSNFDDTALLMPNSSPGNLSGISFKAYREWLSRSGLFDEIVYILDCKYVESHPGFQATSPHLHAEPTLRTSSIKEFLLTSSPVCKTESFAGADADEGLLTRALLDGLRGSAVDPQGLITSTSLGDYVRRRVRDLASCSKLLQLPNILLPGEEIVFREVEVSPLVGTLIVQVPHWSAEVRVLNNLFQSVVSSIKVKESSESPGTYEAEVKLPEGIYKIEVTLEGRSESHFVALQFNQTWKILKDIWKGLKFVSAAPLLGSATTHESHMRAAKEWSNKSTWDKSPGGSSKLFLFVRTAQPEVNKSFAEGLRLLDANEETVTDFSDSVEKNASEGWMAFCADLKPGYYILRRGRPGVRLRQQPLYLCDGWATQIFLEAKASPSLRTMTMSMARKDQPFEPNDESTIAAEAVLDSMRYAGNSTQIVTRENLAPLLKDKIENPWLGILACYALRFQWIEQTEGSEQEVAELLQHILQFLEVISDHPDVRALKLQMDQPASAPFLHPPLLRKGLEVVHQHSTLFRETIPISSLTDRVLPNVLTNSPWTAWRHLADPQRIDTPAAPVFAHSNQEWVTNLTDAALSYAGSILQSNFPKAPVVQLTELVTQTMKGKKLTKGVTRKALSIALQSFADAPVLDILQAMTKVGDLDLLPRRVTVKNNQKLKEALQSVKPEEISKTSGLTLAHAEQGLESLRQATSDEPESSGSRAEKTSLTADEQAVLEYIVTTQAKETSVAPPAISIPNNSLPLSDEPQDDAEVAIMEAPKGSASISIEDCVSTIRGEAARILIPSQEETDGDDDSQPTARVLSERLSALGEHLFQRSAFTMTMNSQNRILSANRAFIELINPSENLKKTSRAKQQQKNIRSWEKALASAPVGNSVLRNPMESPLAARFSVRKSVVEAESSQPSETYLIAMRVKDTPSISQTKLRQVKELLPTLSLYSSFFAYDSAAGRREHLGKLEEVIRNLEELLNDSAAAAAAN